MKNVKTTKRLPILVIVVAVAVLGLGLGAARPAHAQGSVELPPVQFGSLVETLRGATRDSGNTAFGDLFSGLIALDVATAPLRAPAAGIVYRFEDVPDRPRLQTLNFVPLVLGRAATIGGSTATFGFNVVSARYDTASDFSLEALPVATFQGPAPIVTSSALDLSVDTLMVNGFATFGLTDDLDVAVAVPFVGVTLRGSMVQQEAAIGTALFPIDASSFGVDDIAVTGQYRLWSGSSIADGLSARVTLRTPTGNADQLRGIDTWRTMFAGSVSKGFGRLAVHGTAGYESWSNDVELYNMLPTNILETWLLRDQVQVGGGFELAASRAVTVSFEALWRRVGQTGQLELRSVDADAPALGIESGQLLSVGPGGLEKTIMVPGVSVNLGRTMLTFQTVVSLSDTGLRSKFIPLIGLNWAVCEDC